MYREILRVLFTLRVSSSEISLMFMALNITNTLIILKLIFPSQISEFLKIHMFSDRGLFDNLKLLRTQDWLKETPEFTLSLLQNKSKKLKHKKKKPYTPQNTILSPAIQNDNIQQYPSSSLFLKSHIKSIIMTSYFYHLKISQICPLLSIPLM